MPSLIAKAAVAPVLAHPASRSEQVTQLVLGETAALLDRNDAWRRICTHGDGYSGWIHSGYLTEVDDAAADEWRSRASGWSEGAGVRIGDAHLALPLRARVVLEGQIAVLPDGRRGKVIEGRIRPMSEIISTARSQAAEGWAVQHFPGSPYQWGGVTPWGVDCSGLVQTTFAARGVSLPRDSAQQVAHGVVVPLDQIQPGDLLFFRNGSGSAITHVAFAGPADTLVHSTLACGGMVMESWLPGSRAAYLRERLVAVRRLEPR